MSARKFIIRLKSFLATGMHENFAPTAKNVFQNNVKSEVIKLKKILPLGMKIEILKDYYKLEIAPPKFSEMKQLRDEIDSIVCFFKSGKFKDVTVKEAWLYLLVCIEVCLWFFGGEVIGKRHIVGYKV